jgi:hypothetical protein
VKGRSLEERAHPGAILQNKLVTQGHTPRSVHVHRTRKHLLAAGINLRLASQIVPQADDPLTSDPDMGGEA